MAKYPGVVVCSPRLGWAVESYLDFSPIPLPQSIFVQICPQQLRFQKSSKGGVFLYKPVANSELSEHFLSVFTIYSEFGANSEISELDRSSGWSFVSICMRMFSVNCACAVLSLEIYSFLSPFGISRAFLL